MQPFPAGHATASAALQRLNRFQASNRFYAANRELGRALKTEFLLQYMSEPTPQGQGTPWFVEGRTAPRPWHGPSTMAKEAVSPTREIYDQMNACSCLTLILACIIYWQAREISRLARKTDFTFDPSLIQHIRPNRMEKHYPLRRDQNRSRKAQTQAPLACIFTSFGRHPYVDELELRQAIERLLSRVELANRFTRVIAVGNPREFPQVEKEEQEIAEACNRLIKNCIICWNYLYFERRLARMRNGEQKEALVATISSHLMLSWRHVNLLGEYDFSDERLRDSFGLRRFRLAT